MSADEPRRLMQRAERSLRSARNLLDDGDHDFAMSRAYYAMFYAATAALLLEGARRTRHSGLIAAFGQKLVRGGKFTREHQKMLQRAFQDRVEGDYAGAFPSREDVEQRLEGARVFISAVADFLRERGVDLDPVP